MSTTVLISDHIHTTIIDASSFLSQLVEEYGDEAEIDLALSKQITHYFTDIIDLIQNRLINYEPDFLKLCSVLLIQDFHFIIDADIRRSGNIDNAKNVLAAKCGLFQSWFDKIFNSTGSEVYHKGIFFKHQDGNAALNGHLDCLKYAHENGCPWDGGTCSDAVQDGHLDCLKYAHENGCPWDKVTCGNAALNGHLDCLKYAHENGCPWDGGTCSDAVQDGHLDCLKYAHENGCPWDEDTCTVAAQGGHLDCLKYAHENGCPWDEDTCTVAAQGGHLDCFKYAHENGCPWDGC